MKVSWVRKLHESLLMNRLVRPFSCALMPALALGVAVLLGACAEAPQNGSEAAPAPLGQRVFPAEPAQARYLFERALYGRSDLVADKAADFTAMLSGRGRGQDKPAEGLARPQALAAHQGLVFVANAMDAAISVFDLRQQRFFKIGEQNPGALRAPVGLSVNRNGELFVADAAAQAVLVFDGSGRYLRRIGGPGWFSRLVNVTVDPKSNRVYALDQGDVRQQVRVFNGANGAHLFDFGSPGDGPGTLDQAQALAVGPQGQLLVLDSGRLQVQVFDAEGQYLRSFGRPGKLPGEFARPKHLATDAQGHVYVTDSTLANVQVFTTQGDYLYAIGLRSQRDAPGHYLISGGLALDTDGRLMLADQWFGKIEIFRPVRSAPATP